MIAGRSASPAIDRAASLFLYCIRNRIAIRKNGNRVRRVHHTLMKKNETERTHLPPWFKVKAPGGEVYRQVKNIVGEHGLHTVCQSAICPNIGICWEKRTATFMILGNRCTRRCGFCGVPKGRPEGFDGDEARRVASAVATMGLTYAVVTSVTRDDLPDGGAGLFARTITEIRRKKPDCRVEVLIPDFGGNAGALDIVMDARPDVLAHNVETVPRLYRRVRPGADFERSVGLLRRAKRRGPGGLTKSGIMIGLGETLDEVIETMKRLVDAGVDLFTIGQYLSPSKESLPVERFARPEEFRELEHVARSLGFRGVASGPLVRSSYLAENQAARQLAALTGTASPEPSVREPE
jgi:lipoic acid synthetase